LSARNFPGGIIIEDGVNCGEFSVDYFTQEKLSMEKNCVGDFLRRGEVNVPILFEKQSEINLKKKVFLG